MLVGTANNFLDYSSFYVVNTQYIILWNHLYLWGLIFVDCQFSFIGTRRYNFTDSFLYI